MLHSFLLLDPEYDLPSILRLVDGEPKRGACLECTCFRKPFVTCLQVANKHHYLGVFHGEEDAARAYDRCVR